MQNEALAREVLRMVPMATAKPLRLAPIVAATVLCLFQLRLLRTVMGVAVDLSGRVALRGRRILSTGMRALVNPHLRVL